MGVPLVVSAVTGQSIRSTARTVAGSVPPDHGSTEGFAIRLSEPTNSDVTSTWAAFPVRDGRTTRGETPGDETAQEAEGSSEVTASNSDGEVHEKRTDEGQAASSAEEPSPTNIPPDPSHSTAAANAESVTEG